MKRVAVIGAGASGLTAIKCCLDEQLEPVCFERTDDIGGLWNYKEKSTEGQATVMRSTVINTSKEMMCFSDFPIPKEYPLFMHNTYCQKYFNLYADEFDLRKYIRFETEVLSVKRRPDFDQSGKWDIQVEDKNTGEEENIVFDAVLVCTGHHADVHIPNFPGLDRFQGQVTHSHDYRDHRGYEGKRILIIGIGNSGGDIAVELGRVASQVYLSTRRGSWVLNRIVTGGLPLDMVNNSRLMMGLRNRFMGPANTLMEFQLNRKFNHELYSLKPQHRLFSQHAMVNDDLPNRIISGTVIIKPNIKEFTETGVHFDDGTFEDNIDVVLLATGYVFGFPFLEKSVIEVKQNEVNLFKYVFPPDLAVPSLAVIGCVQPLGSVMPISELQCRLATRVFKGEASLPSREGMWQDIRQKKEEMAAQFVKSQRHTLQVDYVSFMDELAQLTGCLPDFKTMFVTDPRLAFTCFFGSCTPYQYRLRGPGAWSGARDAILTQWDRALYPLKTRPLNIQRQTHYMKIAIILAVLTIFLVYMFGVLF